MIRAIAIATALSLLLVDGVTANEGDASSGSSLFAQQEIVVGYHPGATDATRWRVRGAVGAQGFKQMPTLDVIRLSAGMSVAQALARVPQLDQVSFSEPNYRISGEEEPNDPLYMEAWSIGPSNESGIRSGIDTPSAWNVSVGAGSVLVGIVDSGIAMTHPDLAGNIWSNPGESAAGLDTNGSDDDANGYVDDWRGWDWIDQDNDPTDMAGHGTQVAGTVGAQGNNAVGGSGVAWHSKLMNLRVLDAQGIGWTSDAASAFSYAGSAGAQVVNASLTSPVPSLAMLEAISTSPDTLFVVAAGNNSTNNDVDPKFPCNFELPNLLCVAATDERNELASFSNYGAATVDLAAPGTKILTTHPDGYVDFYGTSAASPHVAGVAALIWTLHPEASVTQVAQALMGGVEPLPGLKSTTSSGGRLNAAGALRQLGDYVPEDHGSPRNKQSLNGKNLNQKRKKCRVKRKRNGKRIRRCRRRR